MSKILVTGSADGLGAAIVMALRLAGHTVYEYDIQNFPEGNPQYQDVADPNLGTIVELDVLINNAGTNCIEWFEDLAEAQWDKVIDTNCLGAMKMSQACLPMLKASGGTILNIVSNAAHRPMRCSLAYNASKGALHIMTLQMARELFDRHGVTVFGVAPNKLADTAMSSYIDKQVVETRGWTMEAGRQYQLDGLMTHRETPRAYVADFIAYLLKDKEHHSYLAGCILPYGI